MKPRTPPPLRRPATVIIAAALMAGGIPVLLAWFWVRQVTLDNALVQAVQRRSTSVGAMQGLLHRGARINARELWLPRLSASPECVRDIANWLWRPEYRSGGTALREAIFSDRADLVGELLARGADANRASGSGCGSYPPLLDWSITNPAPNSRIIARLLLDHGAKVNAANDRGMTPLMFAMIYHEAEVRLLLSRSANPNARDNRGSTPLHYGIGAGTLREGAVRALLEYGADVNARPNGDLTPLRRALLAHSPRAVIALLRRAGGRE